MSVLSTFKTLFNKAKATVTNPIIQLILGFISNALVAFDKMEKSEVADAGWDTVLYGILRFKVILVQLAQESNNPYDDKIIEELIEAATEIYQEGGIDLNIRGD